MIGCWHFLSVVPFCMGTVLLCVHGDECDCVCACGCMPACWNTSTMPTVRRLAISNAREFVSVFCIHSGVVCAACVYR
jgi:hypothetical protein